MKPELIQVNVDAKLDNGLYLRQHVGEITAQNDDGSKTICEICTTMGVGGMALMVDVPQPDGSSATYVADLSNLAQTIVRTSLGEK